MRFSKVFPLVVLLMALMVQEAGAAQVYCKITSVCDPQGVDRGNHVLYDGSCASNSAKASAIGWNVKECQEFVPAGVPPTLLDYEALIFEPNGSSGDLIGFGPMASIVDVFHMNVGPVAVREINGFIEVAPLPLPTYGLPQIDAASGDFFARYCGVEGDVINTWGGNNLEFAPGDFEIIYAYFQEDSGVETIERYPIDISTLSFYSVAPTAAPTMLPLAALEPNFPNPFNPITQIRFELGLDTTASIDVFTVSGRLVRRLLDGAAMSAGSHRVTWNGKDDDGGAVAAGTYFYRLEAGEFSAVRKMTMVK